MPTADQATQSNICCERETYTPVYTFDVRGETCVHRHALSHLEEGIIDRCRRANTGQHDGDGYDERRECQCYRSVIVLH